MSTMESRVAEFAGRKNGKSSAAAKVWQQPTLNDLAYGRVLAFDQTITKAGWVFLDHSSTVTWLLAKGTLKQPQTEATGMEDTLRRADAQDAEIDNLITGKVLEHGMGFVVVHEQPTASWKGAKASRPESSMLAALSIRAACRRLGLQCHPVDNIHAKVVLTNNRSADKPEVGRAVTAILGEHNCPRSWNQDERDALAIAFTFLRDRKLAQTPVSK